MWSAFYAWLSNRLVFSMAFQTEVLSELFSLWLSCVSLRMCINTHRNQKYMCWLTNKNKINQHVVQMLVLAWKGGHVVELPVQDVGYTAWCNTVWKTVYWRPSSLWTVTFHLHFIFIYGKWHFIRLLHQHSFLLLIHCSPAMPFVGCPHTNGCGGPGRMLLREMLWQLEQRVLQVQEEEFQYCISRGILGYRHPPAYPNLLALISASEHRQLERLCGRIPPSHTAIVLSR